MSVRLGLGTALQGEVPGCRLAQAACLTRTTAFEFPIPGTYVELAGPFYTLSTAVTAEDQPYEIAYVCGTSFAAPHVAGVAALLWAKNPTWSNETIRGHLNITALPLGPAGWDSQYGNGLVDASAAINTPGVTPTPLSVTIEGPTVVPTNAGEMCSWFASALYGSGAVSYQWRWDGSLVSTEDFYVSDESTEGTYWLEVTVSDLSGSDTDGRWVLVDDNEMSDCFF